MAKTATLKGVGGEKQENLIVLKNNVIEMMEFSKKGIKIGREIVTFGNLMFLETFRSLNS